MDIQGIVAQLRQEANRIENAIAALVGLGSQAARRGRPPRSGHAKPAGGRKRFTMSAAATKDAERVFQQPQAIAQVTSRNRLLVQDDFVDRNRTNKTGQCAVYHATLEKLSASTPSPVPNRARLRQKKIANPIATIGRIAPNSSINQAVLPV